MYSFKQRGDAKGRSHNEPEKDGEEILWLVDFAKHNEEVKAARDNNGPEQFRAHGNKLSCDRPSHPNSADNSRPEREEATYGSRIPNRIYQLMKATPVSNFRTEKVPGSFWSEEIQGQPGSETNQRKYPPGDARENRLSERMAVPGFEQSYENRKSEWKNTFLRENGKKEAETGISRFSL